jgi:hypothetical protein
MRVALRKSSNNPLLRRDQMLFERSRAVALRTVYPDIAQLRIELVFSDPTANTPSPQLHTLFPAAPAFFRFACPCMDCDGDFDLASAISTALDSPTWRKRAAASGSGTLSCDGLRLHDRSGNRSCSMKLHFQLRAAPRSAT